MSKDSFRTQSKLKSGGKTYCFYSLEKLARSVGKDVRRLPFSIRILLENLLRAEDGNHVSAADIRALADWRRTKDREREIAFMPSRVLLQDFTGVPAIVDLAAMRDAMIRLGGDPEKINPLQPADLVIDHSVQVDYFGTSGALRKNTEMEFRRNQERYRFLRWGQQAFRNFRVVPPGTGIVHQVNLEYLSNLVFAKEEKTGRVLCYPDTVVGTDSHTTMINGLGVLGWGVGGIEAEAVMLGQPISMLVPQVVGFRLSGKLPEGATATDLVLTITQILRKKGVVGKFVEFFGPGLDNLLLADRATIANMAPEYGATAGYFPVDVETLRYLRLTGRSEKWARLAAAYYKEQGLLREPGAPDPEYSETVELRLEEVEPSLAGPKRPQDRVALKNARQGFREALGEMLKPGTGESGPASVVLEGATHQLTHGAVVLASITSCTNTSNPQVMLGAGILAKKAVERGLSVKPWVKTSLAPGSQAVADYLRKAGLLGYLEKLRFNLVGYGCMTCIGNSGPLPEPVVNAIREKNLVAVSVLSGNRNFEGRINPYVRANYLASPPLVVAYAIAGTMDVDIVGEPLGTDHDGKPVYLKDIWPGEEEIQKCLMSVQAEIFRDRYADVFKGGPEWQKTVVPRGAVYAWSPDSTYIKHPPYFEGLAMDPAPVEDIAGARVLAMVADSVTTDHISPAGSIPQTGPAGRYLLEHGVRPEDFNSYGSRRGNHEVMIRGTFANIRLKNLLAPGTEGGLTRHFPGGEGMTIFDAAVKYREEKIPLIILAGKEYGAGSSRDWAAKGPALLGVRAVIAESFERIHRSNLIGMGILPLEFPKGGGARTLGLSGEETYSIRGISRKLKPGGTLTVSVCKEGEKEKKFSARCRIDTPVELAYYRDGGILQFVLRRLLGKKSGRGKK